VSRQPRSGLFEREAPPELLELPGTPEPPELFE